MDIWPPVITYILKYRGYISLVYEDRALEVLFKWFVIVRIDLMFNISKV